MRLRNLRISTALVPALSISPIFSPRPLAAQPKWVSRICPTFMREGTPSGLSTMSTGVPSAMHGMSSRSEEHTSELQSPCNLVCRLLLEKKQNGTSSERSPDVPLSILTYRSDHTCVL